MDAIDKAAEVLGSQTRMAVLLGVSKGAVNQWKGDGRKVPDDKCPHIERATDGKVSCEELRPDRKWVRVVDADWPHPAGRPLLDFVVPVVDPAQAHAAGA